MCVALVGGMDRLERVYEQEAGRFGVRLKVFTKITKNLGEKIGNADAVIVFTNKVSHTAKREVMNEAKKQNLPVLQCHACGVCSLRQCLQQICMQRESAVSSPPRFP
jgi:hypothetical protein